MSMLVADKPQADTQEKPAVVNDFTIVVATVNGSGSQTANNTIIRSLFKMGIPVNGKNIFPSNIAGLPTWFTIRANKDGYVARRETTEILVAFNPQTADADLAALRSGGVVYYPEEQKFVNKRDDVIYYPLPVKALVKESGAPQDLRDYVATMVYVGALAQMLNIEFEAIKDALVKHFKGKQKPIDLNYGIVTSAAEWVKNNHAKQDPYRVERMDKTAGKILIDGNTAGALGALFGGVQFVAWYPITPSTSLVDAINDYMPKLRLDPDTGKATCAVVQAEDELAALGMVVGAGWAGARSMTATSGPGISLMAEFTGLAYFAEIPAVIWDITRMGPSTGLPTRVSQGDVLFAYYLGHGDTKQICLLPGSMQECFEFGQTSFDLAERLQTPVFVLSDLDMGMNLWMSDPFVLPEKPLDRGKVLTAEDLTKLGGFARYKDVDGDGIGYRTLPGTPHPLAAYFTRGTGHNEEAGYSESPDDWEKNLERLAKKHDTARTIVPKPIVKGAGSKVGIIAYGSADPAIIETIDRLDTSGLPVDYLRLRALPLEDTTTKFIEEHDRIYVVELNFDGQMHKLLQLHKPEMAMKLRSIAYCDGLPFTATFVSDRILEGEKSL
jgi:2-oxoglutarate/2-oxoacid ferredoxin oxidoreductase subunit alpha